MTPNLRWRPIAKAAGAHLARADRHARRAEYADRLAECGSWDAWPSAESYRWDEDAERRLARAKDAEARASYAALIGRAP